MQERLQKVLAGAGVASRREAESLISSGKVSVNGEVVKELGRKVDPERDTVAVEGRGIARSVPLIYVLLYKPKGYVTTRKDPHATNTVMDLILPPLEQKFGKGDPSVAGLHPIGRLDAQSEGLLILTNDGAFTQALTHPRHQIPKRYEAEVRGLPDPAAVERVRTGIPLFGQRTLPARVRVVRIDRGRNTARLEVEIREGRNQQVRRMLQAVGLPVNTLVRTAIGSITLSRMRPGQWRFLTEAEVAMLQQKAAAPADAEPSVEPSRGERRARGPYAPGRGHAPITPIRRRGPKPSRERGDAPRPATKPGIGPRPSGAGRYSTDGKPNTGGKAGASGKSHPSPPRPRKNDPSGPRGRGRTGKP